MQYLYRLFIALLFRAFPTPHVIRVDWRRDEHDTAHMLLEAAFAGLTNYVEIEKAKIWVTTHPELKSKGPKWYNAIWWRNAEYGLNRLREETGYIAAGGERALTAEVAEDILDLYDWWHRRRQSIDDVRLAFEDSVTDDVEELIKAEGEALKEDDEMFLKLAAIRQHLVS